jgi:chitin synthase
VSGGCQRLLVSSNAVTLAVAGRRTPTVPSSPNFISPLSSNNPIPSMIGVSSAVGGNGDWKTHMKKRSGGRSRPSKDEYGPLGPLDPGGKF